MSLLSQLNLPQREAVTHNDGPCLVLAGAGSGKTRVITYRIAHLINEGKAKSWQILAVTFTNKAAKQMGERVDLLLDGQTRGLSLGTFHSTCARILRREAEFLPFDSNFVIFDADDQRSLVKQAIKEMNIDDKTYRPHSVHNSISRAKNELILPDDYPINTYRDEVVQEDRMPAS